MKKVVVLIVSILVMVAAFVGCERVQEKAEKYCWSCGTGITKKAAYCENCGVAVKEIDNENEGLLSDNSTHSDITESQETTEPLTEKNTDGTTEPQSENPTQKPTEPETETAVVPEIAAEAVTETAAEAKNATETTKNEGE